MADEDDDLRFGDVDGSSNTSSSEGIYPQPLIVAFVVVIILVVGQPLSSSMGGVSMNWIGALVVAAGGLLAGGVIERFL